MEAAVYLHLPPGAPPPRLVDKRPFRAVLVIESAVTPEWRAEVSEWLVNAGCYYMMAWGRDCCEWDTSVDDANLARFPDGEIPECEHVRTTWHPDESLADTFWFAQVCAMHLCVEIEVTYILHISLEGREAEMLSSFADARSMHSE